MLALLVVACGSRPGSDSAVGDRSVTRRYVSMGSELRLTAWTDDEPAALAAFDEAYREFERLDALMSVWRENSDVVRLNAAAGRSPVAVSPATLDVLRLARQVSELTDGKFDVTFGALAGLWRFDHDQDNRIPSRAAVRATLPLVGYERLVIDDPPGTAFLKQQGMRVNLGGIGKGYAVDRAVEILRRRTLRDFLVQSGGDLYVAGRKGRDAWTLGIQDPRCDANRSFATLQLSNATLSTSGDYERAFVANGRRYHHIIDPDRGEPTNLSRSVSIVAPSAALADGLSTGVFLLGPDSGMALIERLPQVEGLIVGGRNEVLVSSGLRSAGLRLLRPGAGP